jgi:hypothetical protein
MGQQQLLLIVLGIIITGVAIGISNQVFEGSSEESNKDCIASELLNLGVLAQQFYSRPKQLGGGGFSYKNWDIPKELDSTFSGTYEILKIDEQEILLAGFPYSGKGYTWFIESTIYNNEIESKIIY